LESETLKSKVDLSCIHVLVSHFGFFTDLGSHSVQNAAELRAASQIMATCWTFSTNADYPTVSMIRKKGCVVPFHHALTHKLHYCALKELLACIYSQRRLFPLKQNITVYLNSERAKEKFVDGLNSAESFNSGCRQLARGMCWNDDPRCSRKSVSVSFPGIMFLYWS
jgi:hypothetical protein